MRILWLSGNSSLYEERTKGYNAGGWIGALEAELTKTPDVELGIAFFHSDSIFKTKINKTAYYPINLYASKYARLKHNILIKSYDDKEVNVLLKIIDDFEPDIIHVWGTEISFGLIAKHTKIPVVIHIQGLLNPILNSYFLPGVSKSDFLTRKANGFMKFINNIQTLRFWHHSSKREIEIIKNCKFFFGRTEWDKSITHLLSPDSTYYHCDEMLRNPFYKAKKWEQQYKNKRIITSVISNPMYKGIDVILKTANILKMHVECSFEWNVYGVNECDFAERLTGLNHKNIDVILKGVVTADDLIEILQKSDVFVHTSYIDNSPNSVCEAQMIGLPVISTNVGGVSSLLIDNVSGLLVPANDPYLLAAKIKEVFENDSVSMKLGVNASTKASMRHDKTKIINSIVSAYSNITSY